MRPTWRRRSTGWPTTSRSTSTATGCWRWLEQGEAEQDRQHAELHGAGGTVELERRADIGRLERETPLADPLAAHQLAVVAARAHQAHAEGARHRRLRPA